MGLFSKRRKNPMTSALTGALLGGTLGAAVPAAYEGLKGLSAPAYNSGNAALDARRAAAFDAAPGYMKAIYKITGGAPEIDSGAPLPEQQTQLQRTQANTGWSDIAKQTAKETLGGATGAAKGYAADNPATAAYHGAVGTAQGLYAARTAAAKRWQQVQAGVQGTKIDMGTPPGPRGSKGAGGKAPADPGLARLKAYVDTASPDVGRVPGTNLRMSGWNPFRRWNEANLGRELGRVQAGATMTGPRFGPIAGNAATGQVKLPGMGASAVNAMQQAGRDAIAARAGKGMIGKGMRGGGKVIGTTLMYAAPHALPWAYNTVKDWWNGAQ
jgi:hypothetical protein